VELKVFITIDDDRCIGIGNCEVIDEHAVVLGPDGIARAVPGYAIEESVAQEMCEGCPSGAISIMAETTEDAV
jgi:ferredoxin